ncbi:5-formyltetrahydrofolate cyclo-ligase [Mycena floridula]|nr:5-formyltetrahydrofolate cyclo-ligase [Mycena floridula]
MSLKTQKKALRKIMSLKLGNVVNIPEQSAAVTAKVLSLPAFQRASSISCYLSMPSAEIDTSLIVCEALKLGKTVFVPKIDSAASNKMKFLKIYDEADLHSLPAGVWGIKEPGPTWNRVTRLDASSRQESLDLILMPGLAFDRSMSRLGHGKGFYDRFISEYTQGGKAKPLLVALALREQVLTDQEIPISDSDWKMNMIVSADEVLGLEETV